MIYIVISDSLGRFSYPPNEKQENIIKKQRDCRVLRQPLTDMPDNLKEYINSAKNQGTRAERELAYTTLLCSLKVFFAIDNPEIKRTYDGKPFLKDEGEKKVNFNISHSEGVVAIALTDEGEIGIDIQAEIDDEKAARLENRFLSGISVCNEKLNAEIYYCKNIDGAFEFWKTDFEVSGENIFSAKWSSLESILKLSGKGFGAISSLSDLIKITKTDVRNLKFCRKKFTLAISVFVKENI